MTWRSYHTTSWPDLKAAQAQGVEGLEPSDDPIVIGHDRDGAQGDRLVVLVHGLGGDRVSTWGRLPEFLFDDLASEGVDIALFGYRSGLSRLLKFDTTDFETHAQLLADAITEGDYNEVVLVGHSLGGLVCKQAIFTMDFTNETEGLKRIKALLLLASPGHGSRMAVRLLGVVNPDARVLAANSKATTQVHKFWNANISGRDPEIDLPTYAAHAAHDRLVDEASATAGALDSVIFPRSHTSICKPQDANDPVYRWVLDRTRESFVGMGVDDQALRDLTDSENAKVAAGRDAQSPGAAGDATTGGRVPTAAERLGSRRPGTAPFPTIAGGGANRFKRMARWAPLLLLPLAIAFFMFTCSPSDDDGAGIGRGNGDGIDDGVAAPALIATPTPTAEPTAVPAPDPTATPRPEPTAAPLPDPTATPEPTETPAPGEIGGDQVDGPSGESCASIANPEIRAFVSRALDSSSVAPPVTVFAPRSADDLLDAEQILASNPDLLDDVLSYHVAEGAASELMPGPMRAANGQALVIGGSVGDLLVNGRDIVTSSEGNEQCVVHVVDGLLVPPTALSTLGIDSLGSVLSPSSPALFDGVDDASLSDRDAQLIALACAYLQANGLDGAAAPPLLVAFSYEATVTEARLAAVVCGPEGPVLRTTVASPLELAATGATSSLLALLGVSLVGTGGLLVASSRKIRRWARRGRRSSSPYPTSRSTRRKVRTACSVCD